jgi:hypothetical protein
MDFALKWQGSARTERAAAQEHFIDLCRMIGAQTPNEADPNGAFYAFEKGAEKTGPSLSRPVESGPPAPIEMCPTCR